MQDLPAWRVPVSKRFCTSYTAIVLYGSLWGTSPIRLGHVGAGTSCVCQKLSFAHTALRAVQREFEKELHRRNLDELQRQAEHKRLVELLEALRKQRDLSQPADPKEGF